MGQSQIAVEIGQEKDFELDDVVTNQVTEEVAQARIGETPRFLMEIENGPGPDQQDDDQRQDVVMFQVGDYISICPCGQGRAGDRELG